MEKEAKKKTAKKGAGLIGLGVVTSAVVLGAAACSSPSVRAADPSPTCGGSGPKLTVQGTGLATGTPNLLTATIDISVTDGTATAALADDNNRATTVTNLLSHGGVAPADVQTSDVSIFPNYNDHGYITGYQVSNTLTAKLRNFANAGSLIDAVAGAAGNAIRLNSLTFSVDDTRALEDQARSDAVHQAVSHARSMALAADERLGPVCSLSDNTQTNSYPPYFGLGQASAADNAAGVPLQPGSQQESDQVTMIYELLPPPLRK